GAAVQQFQPQFVFHCQPALLAEEPIQMDGPIHLSDSIFGEENDLDGLFRKKIEQIAYDGIDGPEVRDDRGMDGRAFYRFCASFLRRPAALKGGGAEPLQIVIQMRQVNQIESW